MKFGGESPGRRGINLGAERRSGEPTSGYTVGPPPITQDRAQHGYSFEKDRVLAREARDKQATFDTPKVQPWILISVACALGFFAIVWIYKVISPDVSEGLGYDNREVLSKYEEYRKGKSSLPTKDEIRRELNAITYLENMGRISEANREWHEVMSEQDDPHSPIYQLALDHLRESR